MVPGYGFTAIVSGDDQDLFLAVFSPFLTLCQQVDLGDPETDERLGRGPPLRVGARPGIVAIGLIRPNRQAGFLSPYPGLFQPLTVWHHCWYPRLNEWRHFVWRHRGDG